MIGPLQNAIRLQVERMRARTISTRIGTVTSYDPNKYAAKVQLQPDGLMTWWLPVASIWIGNGWGLFTPPNVGDLVTVEFINGDIGAGTVTSRFWNVNEPTLPVPSGECWLVHAKGQFIKLTNDGKLTLNDGQGASIVLNGNGTINSAGSWSHAGDINATGTVTGQTDVVGGGKSLKGHTHPDPQGGNTGTPN